MKRRLTLMLPVLLTLATLSLPHTVPVAAAGAPAEISGPVRHYLPLVVDRYTSDLIIVASADACVFESDPEVNQGADLYLFAGYDEDEGEAPKHAMRTLIRFDLPSGISDPVEAAIVRVYYTGYSDFPDQPRAITVHAAEGPWEEAAVNWANQPLRGAAYGSITIRANTEWGYRDFDVTALVQEWLDGSTPNHGLYLIGPEVGGSDYSYRIFQSREADRPPEMVLNFE